MYWSIYQYRSPLNWIYNERFDCFESTKGSATVYIVRYTDEYCLQLFLKGTIKKSPYCLCELRSKDFSKGKLENLFKKGMIWLNFYCDDEEKTNKVTKVQ